MKINAKWITAPENPGFGAVTYRRNFRINKPVKKATLNASAMGIYHPVLNGQKVTSSVLNPGFTSYHKRTQYQSYDVTALLNEDNLLELGVGQGWAVGYTAWVNTRSYFADHPSVITWLDIVYADGTSEQIVTDAGWEIWSSPVLFSELYHGETVDLTAPIEKIAEAVVDPTVKTKLVPQDGEWIVERERLAPVELIHTPAGETVLDFGQNMTGYVEVKIRGKRGDKIVIHHAEVLDKDGNFYNANYRSARNEMTYILSGGQDSFKPTYSFQGFRYIRLTEFPDMEVDLNCFRAVVVHSEMKRTGRFTCGNEKINQLYHNVIWGQKGNYLDIPTDCPQRDERMGWTGDAQVFCRTGAINFDVEKFFHKWLGDVALEQEKDGAVRGIVPNCLFGNTSRVACGWGDAACIIPWEMYLAYGNKKELKKNFPMMKKWVEYIRHAGPNEYLWLTGRHYGDWCATDAGGEITQGATANDLIATAYFAYSTSLLIQAGEVLGYDMSEYRTLHGNIKEAFRDYFMENGMPKAEFPYTEICKNGASQVDTIRKGMTQTALLMILHFDLCHEDERPAIIDKLVELIHAHGDRMSTGFLGTPIILHVLSDNGHIDLAYKLLTQEAYPSWLYSVNHGATTIWEHWNSRREDGSFWHTSMNSFNHYAYGCVFDWIFGVASGIKPMASAPGYKEITLEPHPNKCLGFADNSIESRNGFIRSHWYYKGDTVYYEFEIPEGVTAHLRLPSGYTETLTGGNYHFAE